MKKRNSIQLCRVRSCGVITEREWMPLCPSCFTAARYGATLMGILGALVKLALFYFEKTT